ncbi:hypothetical protein CC761_25375 [Salmonella enterica subsp. enterica serovar Newport]|nr:hypothetical protein [Salmonella enterica subsp. enterica serovar Newport]EHX1719627.1 hypothetical protein [Salmonella enterica subsp. enterica serovar Newport]
MFLILKEMFVRLNKNEPHTTPQKAPARFSVTAYKDTSANKNATGAALAVFLLHLLRTVFKCRLNAFYIGGYFAALNFGRRPKKNQQRTKPHANATQKNLIEQAGTPHF